ncbi:MAG: UTP--glucose-1-phosphate uridylyltransferase GalU [Bdellovibrionales bacterium]
MSMPQKVRTVVFPAAGLGTRFLPATKAIPKEMLTVLDRPLIQWVVEEAKQAGIERFVFVISKGKEAIVEHFRKHPEMEAMLQAKNKMKELVAVQHASIDGINLLVAYQDQPLGLGHAVWCAREQVGNEPFAVVLPDEIVHHGQGALAQAVDVYNKVGGNVITVLEVPKEDVSKYGICAIGSDDGRTVSITDLVEKPKVEEAPSNICIHGRYILQPEIFKILDEKKVGAGGEIQITDAMVKLIGTQPFHGVRVEGERYDCGQKLGFIKANIAMALDDADIGSAVRTFINKEK